MSTEPSNLFDAVNALILPQKYVSYLQIPVKNLTLYFHVTNFEVDLQLNVTNWLGGTSSEAIYLSRVPYDIPLVEILNSLHSYQKSQNISVQASAYYGPSCSDKAYVQPGDTALSWTLTGINTPQVSNFITVLEFMYFKSLIHLY